MTLTARLLLGALGAGTVVAATAGVPDLAWPEITRESRPWAYNWWPGSAVDRTNLTKELRRYRDGGLGGVHIIPIYGVKGAESRSIEYLSPKWMEMLTCAVQEGERLGLGVDMTTGTGWCFGGPQVPAEEAGLAVKTLVLEPPADDHLACVTGGVRLLEVVGRAVDGRRLVLTDRVTATGRLDWQPDGPGWKLYVLSQNPTQRQVKRAAPGGAGFMLNPFYGQAMEHYLERFTRAFDLPGVARPRAMYHDSYEYYGCQWSPDFWDEFTRRRGYRLQDQLEAFAGEGDADVVARVKADYRETVSDLMVENAFPCWVVWCHERGMLTRNQAHGSPANWLDLYALADIPETEMFGRGGRDPLVSKFDGRFGEGDRDPLVAKFASSAAHGAGRRLVAAETCTWLAEHFCETLEEAKCLVDRMLVSGINHVFYHGCCYSPDDAVWPGWLFYAATEMNPRNAIWHDAPMLNAYIARCQAVMQSGTPDNDVLLYWPIHDRWHRTEGTVEQFTVHNRDWLLSEPVGAAATQLWVRGYGFDYVSDRLLCQARAENGATVLAEARYGVVLAPPVRHMPLATLQRLLALAEGGATVVFSGHLPDDVPGFGRLESRRAELQRALAQLAFTPPSNKVSTAKVGKGRVLVGELEPALAEAGVGRETLTEHPGAVFVRRRHEAGRHYFIANQGTNVMQGWFALATPAKSVVVMDPLTGRTGVGVARRSADGRQKPEWYLRLEPGHSLIVRTFADRAVAGPTWTFAAPGGSVLELKGPWQVEFVDGGPVLPKAYQAETLASWTRNGDPETVRFAGTALYATTFDAPAGNGPWLLNLGQVCHSARVFLNGQSLGTLMMNPYRLAIPSGTLQPMGNVLKIEVTNLSANRLRDLDRRQVPWRIFYDINFVNLSYQAFDAAKWPVFDSGLLGPVTLEAAEPAGSHAH